MSRASKPGSESDTRAGMMHRSNIHASPRRRRRRSLVHLDAALNIEECGGQERPPRERGLSVIYGFRAAGPIADAHPLIPADRWTGWALAGISSGTNSARLISHVGGDAGSDADRRTTPGIRMSAAGRRLHACGPEIKTKETRAPATWRRCGSPVRGF